MGGFSCFFLSHVVCSDWPTAAAAFHVVRPNSRTTYMHHKLRHMHETCASFVCVFYTWFYAQIGRNYAITFIYSTRIYDHIICAQLVFQGGKRCYYCTRNSRKTDRRLSWMALPRSMPTLITDSKLWPKTRRRALSKRRSYTMVRTTSHAITMRTNNILVHVYKCLQSRTPFSFAHPFTPPSSSNFKAEIRKSLRSKTQHNKNEPKCTICIALLQLQSTYTH